MTNELRYDLLEFIIRPRTAMIILFSCVGIMFIFLLDKGTDNVSTREANFAEFEKIDNCDNLFSHYRQAIEFERDFLFHGYNEQLYYEFQVKAMELKC